ncbi:MAG: PAS domain-containing protein [Cytophagales bacterium]|nr:PAS domain-containing protein [Cytophaga sp.]
MKNSGYSGVCIDLNYKILQPFGDIKKYLLPELFNLNLLEIIPQQLSIAIGMALQDAIKNNKETTLKKITIQQADAIHSVDIEVIPFITTHNALLVLFHNHRPDEDNTVPSEIFQIDAHTHRYLTVLEHELKQNKDKLAEAYDALEVSNEHLHSYHEELISGNEELQSVNEELQSINKELQTVNAEYSSKIKELAELNDDLDNYFRSTVNSQIFVDRNFIIRKFNVAATKQINLIEEDIGRSVTNISTNIKFDGLIEDIIRVITESIILKKEI